ncbi:MAG: hypothetical protein GWP10_21675 [Nitrospiraceae bacterium]|nr:hypothetical protein [Nitrospiraceae bacterium]
MPLRGWQGKSITVMDINELSSKIIGSAIEVHKTLSALSAENEKYFFFSLRSLRLKRACERAVIFIFLLLLPISHGKQYISPIPVHSHRTLIS